jgi:hypothetical protein
MRTNETKILEFINKHGRRGITNTYIRQGTKIEPHQQVFAITRMLKDKGKIRAVRRGKEWTFYPNRKDQKEIKEEYSPTIVRKTTSELNYRQFEEISRIKFSHYFNKSLMHGSLEGVKKEFDLVSIDKKIVGDAKFYTMVRGKALPPAKFSVIAEHVWLLEKTQADKKFLVFGNDRRVPELWLQIYGNLNHEVEFYFLSDDGKIEKLN